LENAPKNAILVPVDFSLHSEAALKHAAELAECMKIPLVILHVVHDPAEMPGYYTKMLKKKRLAKMEDLANEMLEEFMKSMIKKHPKLTALQEATSIMVVGLPVTRILEVAKRLKPRFVVMGSQGRTGLRNMLLGSKAEQVVKLCKVPVTIVKTSAKA
ncbi:MAG: universal stress protein, partial [Pseudomonadota bacterium]